MGQKLATDEIEAIELALSQAEKMLISIRHTLAGARNGPVPDGCTPSGELVADQALAALAGQIYRFRRIRDGGIPQSLLGEPAWDMILDLFEKTVSGQSVSVSSACIAASVPGTTALRWLNVLLNEGLVERHSHKGDGRVSLVRLTNLGKSYARQCLSKHAFGATS